MKLTAIMKYIGKNHVGKTKITHLPENNKRVTFALLALTLLLVAVVEAVVVAVVYRQRNQVHRHRNHQPRWGLF